VVDASVLIVAGTDSSPIGAWTEDLLVQGGVIAPHLVMAETTKSMRLLR